MLHLSTSVESLLHKLPSKDMAHFEMSLNLLLVASGESKLQLTLQEQVAGEQRAKSFFFLGC